jgi:hypothetical protein
LRETVVGDDDDDDDDTTTARPAEKSTFSLPGAGLVSQLLGSPDC